METVLARCDYMKSEPGAVATGLFARRHLLLSNSDINQENQSSHMRSDPVARLLTGSLLVLTTEQPYRRHPSLHTSLKQPCVSQPSRQVRLPLSQTATGKVAKDFSDFLVPWPTFLRVLT